jgi:hypothetical protein
MHRHFKIVSYNKLYFCSHEGWPSNAANEYSENKTCTCECLYSSWHNKPLPMGWSPMQVTPPSVFKIIISLQFLRHKRVFSSGDNNVRPFTSAPRQRGRRLCHNTCQHLISSLRPPLPAQKSLNPLPSPQGSINHRRFCRKRQEEGVMIHSTPPPSVT